METRNVDYSRTEQSHLLRYEDINGAGRLFGGTLISWIDEVACIVARRHTGRKTVTTASIDNLQFKQPAFLDDTIVIMGHITYVGNTSMEVRVDSYLEDDTGIRRVINRAYLIIVCLDEDGHSSKVPPLVLENDVQKEEWSGALKRIEYRKTRRTEVF